MLANLLQDLRYAARVLRKNPAFALVATAVIALGSGAVTTIFSATNAVLLRPIPGVARQARLVEITRTEAGQQGSLTPSYPFYTHVRDETHTMSGVAAWSLLHLTVSTGGEGTEAFANMVSAGYFTVLGVRPALGRFFLPEEEHTPGAHPVIVLSDGFWRRRFGGDPAVVGKPVLVDGEPYTVVGVAPAGFSGIYPVVRTDAWVPLMMAGQLGREEGILTNAGAGWLSLFGRLKDGVSEAQGRADLASIAAAHVAEEPKDLQVFTDVSLTPFTGFPPFASGALISFAALLLAVSALVLVIAGVNVAGMLLARAMARRREMAVRTALGASRGRLVRQMLTESALLFSGGAVGGLLIAYGGARLLGRFQLPAEVPLAFDLDPDVRVLVFCLATALATGLFFGLAPALQAARRDPGVSLRSDTAGAGAHRSRLRSALVVGQMALSLLLLMTAGLFLRALDKGRSVPTGFDTSHVATAPIDVSTAGYPDARARLFYDALKARLLAAPGVTAVSYTRILPLTFSNSAESFRVEGYTPPAERSRDGMVDVHFAIVAPGYFDVLRIPLVRGRAFTDADAAASPHVAVVNESFVARYWPGTDPIGRTLNDGQVTVTVVGVARDVKYESLSETPQPFLYVPVAQNWRAGTNLLVRTTGGAASLAPVIRDAVRAVDPLLPAPQVITMDDATSVVLLPQRIAAGVTGVMGVLGLLLAAVGLYGIVAFTVGLRTREIGVRMALGATRRDVLRLVIGDGMRLAAIGIGAGMLLAAGLTRVMAQFLFGVSALDPLVFAVIPLALAAVALLAAYVPARRAAAADPLVALRAE